MNFEWLYDVPSSGWSLSGTLLRHTFPLNVFKKNSGIVDDPADSWRSTFDRWGNAQARRFRHFSPPPTNRTENILIVQNAPKRGDK